MPDPIVLCSNTAAFLNQLAASYYPEPWGGECGGRGSCTMDGVCQCDAGWGGKSDFINTEGILCDINELAIHVLWNVNFVYFLICIWTTRNIVREKWRRHTEQVKRAEACGQKYRLRDNKGLAAIVVYLCIAAPSVFIVGLLMMITFDQRIGMTWGITILFFLTNFGFYCMVYLFQPQLLTIILRGSRARTAVVSVAQTWGLASFLTSIVAAALPFVTLLFSSGRDTLAQAVYMAYFAMNVVAMIIYGTQAFVIRRKFNMLVSAIDSTKQSATAKVRDRLTTFQHQVIMQAIAQGALYFAFLMIPYLYNKHEYFLPISWMGGHEVFRELVNTSASVKGSSSSSDPASGSLGDSGSGSGRAPRGGFKEASKDLSSMFSPSSTGVFSMSMSATPVAVSSFSKKASMFRSQPDGDGDGDDYV